MTPRNSVEYYLFLSSLILMAPLFGAYMAAIFQGKKRPLFSSLESLIYKTCDISSSEEMTWKQYGKSLLLFNLCGFVALFFLQLFQQVLPFNPQNFSGVEPALAFNTAISFTTNTNWQNYGGEITLSYLTQMMGMTVQNFLSAATGNCVLLALIRGFQRKKETTLGSFWVDLTRMIVYILLPLSIVFSIFLIGQGVIQNLDPYVEVSTLEGEKQVIPMGPAASQIAIKQLGTNGGGFFNANSAHPFENPTPLSNFLENFAILLIPASTCYMYGFMIRSKKQGCIIFLVMLVLWIMGLCIAFHSEMTMNPVLGANPVLEGVETRLGTSGSVLWAVSTTATSNGSVNNLHTSLSPLAGGITLLNMMTGEVIFGGVGVGLCGMLTFILLTVFIAGLMVGRTPEYLGKKIEKTEMQWAMIAILTPCALTLLGAGLVCLLPREFNGATSGGPHALSEILAGFSSAAGNNGSAFTSLNSQTLLYNVGFGIIMLLGRIGIILPCLAIAGSLVGKNKLAESLGTISTETFTFFLLLIAMIVIVAALTFFPALSLGPIVEHLLMINNQSF